MTHIDDATIEALTGVYRDLIPPGSRVLDLMSSWISHLPPEVRYERVAGLGMNHHELSRNARLDDFVVHDLNREPELPYGDGEFDIVLNAVSAQYLARPLEVFAAVWRVLRPGGTFALAISHRVFPQKAVAGWQALPPQERVRLVGSYFAIVPGWSDPLVIDRSPAHADPLWLIAAQRIEPSAGGEGSEATR